MRQLPLRQLIIAAAVVAVALPASTWAAGAFLSFGIGGPCGGCGFSLQACLCPPCLFCHCPPPACVCPPPMIQTGMIPTVQTQYRPEQYVTYREIPRTEIRREAYVEQVPVITYEQVTETVYVPQQVTRTVPRTVLSQQTRYRDVPYQVVERVPQVHTRLVPEQRVSYLPGIPSIAGCSGCGEPSIGYAPPPTIGYTPSPTFGAALPAAAPAIAPTPAAIPTMPPISVSPSAAPEPVPHYEDVNWSTVPSRNTPTPAATPSPRGASLFRPAPSAATVWQSRF